MCAANMIHRHPNISKLFTSAKVNVSYFILCIVMATLGFDCLNVNTYVDWHAILDFFLWSTAWYGITPASCSLYCQIIITVDVPKIVSFQCWNNGISSVCMYLKISTIHTYRRQKPMWFVGVQARAYHVRTINPLEVQPKIFIAFTCMMEIQGCHATINTKFPVISLCFPCALAIFPVFFCQQKIKYLNL